ncbi:plexin-B2 [Ascaphus truei]|uniref:plexin-B2 n=1 Tax=Ascaphus truei TaxID=8439 RepID=UPI003F596901
MAVWIYAASILNCLLFVSKAETFKCFASSSELNQLTVNNENGTVYIGAIDHLYQLTALLDLQVNVTTGPRLDDKTCTPPIDTLQCPNAVNKHNYNKLLVLDVPNNRIVVCGSIFKGICSLRKLDNITAEISYDDSKGEKSFVASNDETLSNVGLVTNMFNQGPRVLFVGKGYDKHDNGITISTRILDEKGEKGPFETILDSATFKSASVEKQQFVAVFEHDGYVYFISTLHDKAEKENRTLISRLCKNDTNYYSYIEMDLECKDKENDFTYVCNSVFITSPGEELAQTMSKSAEYGDVLSTDKVLFAVYSKAVKDHDSVTSALCMFSLKQINKKFEENRDACYTQENVKKNGKDVFFKPNGNSVSCGVSSKDATTASKYPCGSEHLPYPLGSRDGVLMKPVLLRENNQYTSVAVAVENEHTIAFLGTSEGKLVKAFLGEQANEYRTVSFETNSAVKNGIAFDATKDHIYVMNKKKVYRVPVQDCQQYTNCRGCTQARDPYCGWCVKDGKCSRKVDCPRADDENHWLWSPAGTCIKIESANPKNMSRMAPSMVTLTVNPSITLKEDDKLLCDFGDTTNPAELGEDGTISCRPPKDIPSTEKGKDYVSVPVKLRFETGSVFFADFSYPFYDCKEAMHLSENLPCISCVKSKWNCQWDMHNHWCEESSTKAGVIKHSMEEECPQFYEPDPSIIPMQQETMITFTGKNLGTFAGQTYKAGNDEFKFITPVKQHGDTFSISIPKFSVPDKETEPLNIYIKMNENKIDSKLNVNLYNCFYGRSDCSLCLAADPKYHCVWCNDKCVYKDMCTSGSETECPAPVITDFEPKAAPLNGGILLTIKGSNLGIGPQDVEHISVAGVECKFKSEFYSVSTRVVCEVGQVMFATTDKIQGNIDISIKGKQGTSPHHLLFTYQEPEPLAVNPTEGLMAGGNYLTITGNNLRTGSMSDIKVTLNGISCTVTTFGEEIVCVTGQATQRGEVSVNLFYGNQTIKEAGKFTYRENPVIDKFSPDKSFVSGGRNITITGARFNLVQNFTMITKLLSSRKKRQASWPEFRHEDRQDILEKVSDTVIIFSSPQVPEDHLDSGVITVIKMDGLELPLQTTDLSFTYIADPTFENFTNGIKKQVNNIINAKGTNLNDAMTKEEAEAFVGESRCTIDVLTATDLYCIPPEEQPQPRRRQKRDTTNNLPEFIVKFGKREWNLGKVEYGQATVLPLNAIIPAILVPMLLIIGISVYCYWRKSQQAEREYEKVRLQLEGLEESVRERCKKEFTDLMIEMEDQTSETSEAGIPFLDYKTYTDRVFFLPSKDGAKDVMITGKLDIPEARRQDVDRALTQFSNLLNSKSFLTIFIHTLENQKDFSAREKLYFASLLTVALHGKLEYYTDIMRTLFLELMEQYVAKNPKLMLRRSETVVERMLSNWMSICLYQYLKDTAGEPLYKLFKAIKHQVEKGPVDAVHVKAKYTLNDTGLLGDDVEYTQLTVNVIVQEEGGESVPVKVLNCDTITQVKEKLVDQVYRNIPYSLRPKGDSLALEWRPGSTAQILSDLDLTSQKEGRSKRFNTLMHYNVRDGATLILSKIGISQQQEENHHDFPGERHALLEDENRTWHLIRPADEMDDGKSKRGSMKEKERTKAITEIYLTRLLSVKGTLQQFVDNFFQSVLNSNQVVPPAVKYFFDFLDEQAEKHEIKDEDTVHIWKTNSLSLRFWVNILKNPHFIFDVHVHQVVDASLSVIAQTFMDACSRTEHKLSRESPSNKLLYAKEISTYKKMVEDYYKGIRQMVQVSDQDMNTHLAEISREHTESLNTLVALHQLYQYTNKYYDAIINALEEDPGAQRMQLAYRLQQIAAALENKVTDL